jgi:hypothetical protein
VWPVRSLASDTFETALASALSQLSRFLADADQLTVSGRGQWASGNDILPLDDAEPLRVILRLKVQASHEYHAALRLIQDPVAIPAVELICRGLLENFAHMYWVAEGEPNAASRRASARKNRCLGILSDPDSSRLSRAVCLELGMAQTYDDNLRKASTHASTEEARDRAKEWLNDLTVSHKKTGCSGRGRDWRDVQWALRSYREQSEAHWPLDLWYVSSATSHQLMPHRLAREVNGVVQWGGPSTPVKRCEWLYLTTIIFVNVYLYFLGVLRPDKVPDYDILANDTLTVFQQLNALAAEASAAAEDVG